MLWGARPPFCTSSGDGGRGEVVGVCLLPSAGRGGAAGATAGTWHRRCDPSCGQQGVGGAAEAPRAQPAAGGPRRRARTPPLAPRGPRGGDGESERGWAGEAPPRRLRGRPGTRLREGGLREGGSSSRCVSFPSGLLGIPSRARSGAVGPALPSPSPSFSARLSQTRPEPEPSRQAPAPAPAPLPCRPPLFPRAPRRGRRGGRAGPGAPALPPHRHLRAAAPAVGEGLGGSRGRAAGPPLPSPDPTAVTDRGSASIFTEIRRHRTRASARPRGRLGRGGSAPFLARAPLSLGPVSPARRAAAPASLPQAPARRRPPARGCEADALVLQMVGQIPWLFPSRNRPSDFGSPLGRRKG